MKIPLHLPLCDKCNADNYAWINLNDDSFTLMCSCGEDISGSLDITPGFKALYRSEYELLHNQDYSLSIVFSATAVEWELVSLHNKWMYITELEKGKDISTSELEEIWIKHRNVFDRLKETGKLLHPDGFVKYVANSKEFHSAIVTGFPSLNIESLISDIHKNLFSPRNKILHYAYDSYNRDDSIRSYNIAMLSLKILYSMDMQRREIL